MLTVNTAFLYRYMLKVCEKKWCNSDMIEQNVARKFLQIQCTTDTLCMETQAYSTRKWITITYQQPPLHASLVHFLLCGEWISEQKNGACQLIDDLVMVKALFTYKR